MTKTAVKDNPVVPLTVRQCDARLKKLRRDLKVVTDPRQEQAVWDLIDGVLEARFILDGGKP